MFINLLAHAWNTAELEKSLINEFMQIYSPPIKTELHYICNRHQ